jgi:hypothetical protein
LRRGDHFSLSPQAFIETAREIGADEKRSAADKLMERLAKTKPEPRKKQREDARC